MKNAVKAEGDRPEESLENELVAMRQRVAELEAILEENARRYDEALQEIAELKQAEEALRRLQELTTGIVHNMTEGIVMDDAEGYITFVNPVAAVLLGYEPDELVDEHWTTIIPPDQHAIAQAANERRAHGQSDRYEIQVICRDSTRVPILVSGSPRFDLNTGRFTGTLAVFTDLTKRVRVEEELRQHRDRLDELVKERTAALTEANVKLHQEIAEREQVEAERERLLAAERTQAQRQAALVRLSAELTATLDEAEVCQRVVDGLRATLGYDILALCLLDESTGDRVVVASVGFVEPPIRMPPGEGLSERPLLDGQLHYTPDVTQDPHYFYGMGGSEVDVPIRIRGEVLGVLVAECKERDAFDQDDFEVLTAASQQAGLAIEKARLLAAERRRADQLDGLRTTMADITAELELSTLLQAIVERATGLLNASGGELGLYDGVSQEVRIVVCHNMGEDYVGTRHALGEGAMGHVAETGKPLFIEDYRTWKRRAPQYTDTQVRAVLVAPLEVGGRLVGVISSATTDPDRRFGPTDLHLLNLFAQQAAIAIENARLFEQAQEEIAERKRAEEEAQRRAAQAALLYEVGQRVSSELEREELFSAIVTAVFDAFGYYSVALVLLVEGTEWLDLEAIAGGYVDVLPEDTRIAIGKGMVGYAAATGETQISGDVSTDPYYIRVADEETKSELAVPIKSGQKVIGVLDLQSKEFDTFDETDVMLMETLADQVAVALDNARLFDQAQGEIAERKRAEAELRTYQEHLEELVEERTADLRESEERYRTLFDGVPVGLYRATPAGQIVDANLAMAQMLGFPSREELLTTRLVSLYVDPEDRVRWQTLMEREGIVRDFEYQIRRPDGTVIWANDTARAVKDERGQVLYYEGSVEDVTERKRAEEELRTYQEHLEELVEGRTTELRESEERYRTLFDGVPVGLYRATPAGQIVDANLAMAQMLGHPNREEILLAGNTADLYVAPEEHTRWQALMEQEGVVRDFETQVYKHDGVIIWVSQTARAVKDGEGQVLYYEGSLEDITERKKFEEEIRRQKDYFEALFVNSPVAVVTADMDANVVAWNPAAEKLFRYTQKEAIGKNLDGLVANDPTVRTEALSYTNQAFRMGRVQARTKRTRKDGSFVDVEILALPVIVAGRMVGYIVIYHDISELQKARREAEAANRAKSAFLASMSHELRTPLNAILGFTQLMDRDPNLTAEQQENLGIINRSGEHLLALINDVLEMSKIEAGRVTLQETSFDLHRLLDGLEEMFALRARDKGLVLSFERAEHVPQFVRADEGKLRQVLSNLLGNAVRFTQQGGVALRAMALPGPDGKGKLRFEVEDTGIGIAPEELDAVFDPFVQATRGGDLVSTPFQDGTGLGLSISRQFARLMGGDITVSSELGRGSLFKLDVPVELAEPDQVQEARPTRRVVGLEPDQRAADGGPYRLLVAEDKETNRRLLVKLLERLGFEVREVVNGQEAIEVWAHWEPHLIWMDMRMPVMDGYEATRRIKATAKGQTTAIIALTASAFEEDRERVLSQGCDDFVRKPFREDEIFDVLVRHLGVRFVYEEEQMPPAPARPEDDAISLPAALAALPAEWVSSLQQATIRADLNLILTLIDQVRGENPVLADELVDLANDFEYKTILTLIEQAGG